MSNRTLQKGRPPAVTQCDGAIGPSVDAVVVVFVGHVMERLEEVVYRDHFRIGVRKVTSP